MTTNIALRQLVRLPRADGSVMHAEVAIGDSIVMMGDGWAFSCAVQRPETHRPLAYGPTRRMFRLHSGCKWTSPQLKKVYSSTQETTRYSPAAIISTEKLPIFGEPEEDNIRTSHIERFNLMVRMTLRRFTRLTNAHSKSLRHHTAMQALFVAWYNFAREA
jgi:hypothetical protein